MVGSFLSIRAGLVEPDHSGLLAYQLAKLDTAPDGTVLLLGDSSLGNTIAAAAWSQALGRPVVNAALTGEFGYQGSLNLLRRALRRFRPSLVVLLHTLEMPRRRPEWKGLVYTAETPADLAGAPLGKVIRELASLDLPGRALARWLVGPPALAPGLVDVDYSPQRSRKPGAPRRRMGEPQLADEVREKGLGWLDPIGALCRAEGLPCLYAHGPFPEPFCTESAAYIAAANERITQAGLHVVSDTPLCMPQADVGDSEDHVAPELKAAYSEAYRKLVLEAELAAR